MADLGQHDLGCTKQVSKDATYNADGCVQDSRDIIVVIETFQRNVIVVFMKGIVVAFDHITIFSKVRV